MAAGEEHGVAGTGLGVRVLVVGVAEDRAALPQGAEPALEQGLEAGQVVEAHLVHGEDQDQPRPGRQGREAGRFRGAGQDGEKRGGDPAVHGAHDIGWRPPAGVKYAPARGRRDPGRAPLLRLRGIRKAYPGVVALDGVDFDLRAGEVHVLLGENGAGKSTFVRILSGATTRDAGEIEIDGRAVEIAGPRDAQKLGISAIYQEFNLVPQLSAAENIFLGPRAVARRRDGPAPPGGGGGARCSRGWACASTRARPVQRARRRPAADGRGGQGARPRRRAC